MRSLLGRLVLSNLLPFRFARHFLFWLFWWIFQGFIYGFYYTNTFGPSALYISYGESMIFLLQHMFLSYGLMYYVLPQFFIRDKYISGTFVIVLLIIMTALFSPVLSKTLIKTFREYMNFPVKSATVFYSFMGGLRGSLTVAGFAVAIKLLKYWYVNNMEKQKLQKENVEARLLILKGQLEPHFMFNTLNSIYSLSLKNSDQTSAAILRLAQLMRYIVIECNSITVPLDKEISMLYDYIELEKNRLGSRLDMTINIEGDIYQKNIPPLLLLPLVENCFKYGAHESVGQAWISLDLNVQGYRLKFKLINGKPEVTSTSDSLQIGLQNVMKRLELLYPRAHDLKIAEDSDTFVVSLDIALDKIKWPTL